MLQATGGALRPPELLGGDIMTKQEIEDYINTYRIYPEEYKGIRDEDLIHKLEANYSVNIKTNIVTRLEGRINNNGDFVEDQLYEFPFFEPEKKKPTKILLNNVIKSYNKIATDLGYPLYKNSWNLRDMVASLDYIRSTYNINGDNHYLKTENYKLWYKTVKRLEWFITKHRAEALTMECTEKHNSKKYD